MTHPGEWRLIAARGSAVALVWLVTGCTERRGTPPAPAAQPPIAAQDGNQAAPEPEMPVAPSTNLHIEPTPAADQPAVPPQPEEPAAREPADHEEALAALESVRQAVMAGDFHEALSMAREYKDRYRHDSLVASELYQLQLQLVEMRREAPQLRFALSELVSDVPRRAETARMTLLDAGDIGSLMLRSAALGSDPTSAAAIRLLGEIGDTNAVPVLQNRVLDPNVPPPVRSAALAALKVFPANLDPAFMHELVGLVRMDTTFAWREAADLLIHIYAQVARKDDDAFDERTMTPGAAFIVKAYTVQALSAEDPSVREWAGQRTIETGIQQHGLRGSYYAGVSFNRLVFERLDSSVHIADLDYRFPDGRCEDLSVRWTGFLIVPQTGSYTLSSASDDGQRVWVDAGLVIDDWNYHGVEERSATLALPQGLHALRVEHMQGSGGGSMSLSWTGPDIPKQLVPESNLTTPPWTGQSGAGHAMQQASPETVALWQALLLQPASPLIQSSLVTALRSAASQLQPSFLASLLRGVAEDSEFVHLARAELLTAVFQDQCRSSPASFDELLGMDGAADTLRLYVEHCSDSGNQALATWASRQGILHAPGLRGQYFEGTEFGALCHEQLDTSINITAQAYPFPDGRKENLSIRWTGNLLVTEPGPYTLFLTSDDGMRLWLDNRLLIDDWTMHAATEAIARLNLDPGSHALRVEHMQGTGDGMITLEWVGPGAPERTTITGDNLRTEPWPHMHAPVATR